MAWFAPVLVPELGQSGSLDQVEGGWTVGMNRVAAVEVADDLEGFGYETVILEPGHAPCEIPSPSVR